MVSLLESYERWLSVGRRYLLACGFAIAMGWVAYWPLWRTHFFADDVDFFGGMCVALNARRFWAWVWTPFNGHFSVPTKLCYWAVWRWGGRDVFWWHLQAIVVFGGALAGVAALVREIWKSRAVAVAVVAMIACSGAYRTLLMDPPCLNHLWAAGAVVWSLWAAFRYVRGARGLSVSVAFGVLGFVSTAMGLLSFGFLLVAALLGGSGRRSRRFFLAAVGAVGLIAAGIVQIALGGTGGRPDVLFGLRETAHGLNVLRGWVLGPMDFSRLFVIGVCCWLLWNWRRLEWRKLGLGACLMIGPLLLATSFRSDFPGAGAWSRYAFLPLVGFGIWVGQALVLPVRVARPTWMRPGAVLFVLMALFVGCVWRMAAKNNRDVAAEPRELFALERRIGEAVTAYATTCGNGAVGVPTRVVALPASPHSRPLDYLARYCVAPELSCHVIGVADGAAFDAFLIQRDPDLAGRLGD